MTIDEKDLKQLIKDAMDSEAEDIMAEVNSDSELRDVVAPEEIHDKLFAQIRKHEANKAGADADLTAEQLELIRLGKKYKKKMSRRKYVVLIAAVVCALAIGTVSFGDGKKVIQEVKDMIAGKEQMNIDENGERTGEIKSVSEEEAYEQIEEKFGIWAVRMIYLPESMEFEEVIIEDNLQSARLYYTDTKEKRISCYIATSYREGSVGTDVEDKLLQEFKKEINGTIIEFQEYRVEELETSRWCLNFTYQETQYSIIMTGIKREEVKKIAENLYFS